MQQECIKKRQLTSPAIHGCYSLQEAPKGKGCEFTQAGVRALQNFRQKWLLETSNALRVIQHPPSCLSPHLSALSIHLCNLPPGTSVWVRGKSSALRTMRGNTCVWFLLAVGLFFSSWPSDPSQGPDNSVLTLAGSDSCSPQAWAPS